jgi:hypothetical protein
MCKDSFSMYAYEYKSQVALLYQAVCTSDNSKLLTSASHYMIKHRNHLQFVKLFRGMKESIPIRHNAAEIDIKVPVF